MEPAEIERGPRERSGADHIRPEAPRPAAPEPERQQDGRRHQSGQQRERQRSRRIEDRKNHQTQRVVGNRDQQQEGNRRVACRKDEPRDHRGEGDVGGARNRPAAHQLARPVHRDQRDVDQRGRRHPADGGRKRRQAPAAARPAVRRAAWLRTPPSPPAQRRTPCRCRWPRSAGSARNGRNSRDRDWPRSPRHGSREQQQRIVEDEAHAECSRKPFWRRDLRPSSDCNFRIMSGFTPRSPWTRRQYAQHTGHATTGSVGSRHERRLPRRRAVPTLVERNEE